MKRLPGWIACACGILVLALAASALRGPGHGPGEDGAAAWRESRRDTAAGPFLAAPTDKRRLFVLTDINDPALATASACEAVVNPEKDDIQSLVRLLAYSHHFSIEGLVATRSRHRDKICRPAIDMIVTRFGEARTNLMAHQGGYPTVAQLRAVVATGKDSAGSAEWGAPKYDSAGASLLIKAASRADDRPLHVAIWGGAGDLAQAIWRVHNDAPAGQKEAARRAFVSKLRVYSVTDQDRGCYGSWAQDTSADACLGVRLRQSHPDLFYAVSKKRSATDKEAVFFGLGGTNTATGGYITGGDDALVDDTWISKHASGHGALGRAYPRSTYKMEGDSNSWLALLDVGLGDPARPTMGGWGGRYARLAGTSFRDASDRVLGHDNRWHTKPSATVWRFREAIQNDFASMLDRVAQPDPAGVNHPPVAVIPGGYRRSVPPGTRVDLSAVGTSDPDGHARSYRWWHYNEADTYAGATMAITNGGARTSPVGAYFFAPTDVTEATGRRTLHIVLEVKDLGSPPLTRYRRLILSVEP